MVTTARRRPGFEALAPGGSGTSTNAEGQGQRERVPDENDAALCGREPLPLPLPVRALRVGALDDEPFEPDDVRAPELLPRERC